MKRLAATICLTTAVLLGSTGAGYALPYCPSDQNQNYHNCYGTYSFANGRILEGLWKDGKFQYARMSHHGHETPDRHSLPDDCRTSWKCGVGYALPPFPDQRRPTTSPWLNYFGTFTWADGGKYVGEYRNGKGNGQGTSIATNGDRHIIDMLSQMPVLPVNVTMSDAN